MSRRAAREDSIVEDGKVVLTLTFTKGLSILGVSVWNVGSKRHMLHIPAHSKEKNSLY